MSPARITPTRAALVAALVLAACDSTLVVAPDQQVAALPAMSSATDSPDRIELGRLLFWDPLLSGDRDVACATCHNPDHGYSDGLDVSVGVGGRGRGPARASSGATASRTRRNSMTVLDTVFNGLTLAADPGQDQAPMFWDNRVQSLELQALAPIKSELEMRGPHHGEDEILAEVVARLAANAEYGRLFAAAFGSPEITDSRMAAAIAAFERALTVPDSSFDRFLRGDDDAITPQQKRGYLAFVTAGCAQCHSGPMFSDFRLHRLGVPGRPGEPPDPGAGDGRFRTASLRMVARTPPYMHGGQLRTLDDVFDFYDDGIDPSADPLLGVVDAPMGAGRDDLRAFLESISDGTFDREVPARVPSGLTPGGL